MKEEEGKRGRGRGGGEGRVGRLEGVYHLFWLAGVYLDVLPLVCGCCWSFCWLLVAHLFLSLFFFFFFQISKNVIFWTSSDVATWATFLLAQEKYRASFLQHDISGIRNINRNININITINVNHNHRNSTTIITLLPLPTRPLSP